MNSKDTLRVLIVEDSAITAEQLRELIGNVNPHIACSTVATESDAVAAVVDGIPPHVMVLDLHLKEGSGFGVLKKIRAIQPKPVVIVLTNFAAPQYRDGAIRAGADYFLDKEMIVDELPDVLRSLVRMH